ncbi:MAG: hypothetical protein OER82_03500 [Nitrosopumilus sp.]|nr:hypothetical protein [Nitrosopumilus sp.]
MTNKDKINKISGIVSLITLSIILVGYVTGNDSVLGFSNAMMLYVLMPSALIWFGTRKNGCGSCNQTCSLSEPDKDVKNKI